MSEVGFDALVLLTWMSCHPLWRVGIIAPSCDLMCYWKRCCRLSHPTANKGEKNPDLQVIASHEKSHPDDCSRSEGMTFLMNLCYIFWQKLLWAWRDVKHHWEKKCLALGSVGCLPQGWPGPARGTCLQGLGTGARSCCATCPVPGGPLAAPGTVWGLRDPPQLWTPFSQD